jgi:hypothetical protein
MTSLASGIQHLHGRPTWDCRICTQPWPCPTARADLTEEFREFPSVLTVYMAAQMHEALADLASENWPQAPRDLYVRFLSWIRHTPPESVARSRRTPTPQMKAAAAVNAPGRARFGNRGTFRRATAGQ